MLSLNKRAYDEHNKRAYDVVSTNVPVLVHKLIAKTGNNLNSYQMRPGCNVQYRYTKYTYKFLGHTRLSVIWVDSRKGIQVDWVQQ